MLFGLCFQNNYNFGDTLVLLLVVTIIHSPFLDVSSHLSGPTRPNTISYHQICYETPKCHHWKTFHQLPKFVSNSLVPNPGEFLRGIFVLRRFQCLPFRSMFSNLNSVFQKSGSQKPGHVYLPMVCDGHP